jgi:hypothetical protein
MHGYSAKYNKLNVEFVVLVQKVFFTVTTGTIKEAYLQLKRDILLRRVGLPF